MTDEQTLELWRSMGFYNAVQAAERAATKTPDEHAADELLTLWQSMGLHHVTVQDARQCLGLASTATE